MVPSLVVQRLRRHASNERNVGLIPGWGPKICILGSMTKKKKIGYPGGSVVKNPPMQEPWFNLSFGKIA